MRLLLLTLLLCFPSVSGAEEVLPRVLIIGDMVYREPAQSAAKELKGKIAVSHANVPAGRVLHSGISLESLDDLLGEGEWDLIHFNFGLGDLVHRAPGMQSVRVLPLHSGGVRMTSPADYESNLRSIVERLKKTGATLVWANTTPIRASTKNVFEVGSEIEYNAIAARVMAEHSIPINDMHAHARSLMDMDKPASHGADPFSFDKKPLHPHLIQVFLKHLNIQ